jgi:hypothetical protein
VDRRWIKARPADRFDPEATLALAGAEDGALSQREQARQLAQLS